MAEAGERTEQPTARRLTKAKSEGSLPTSQEMISAVTLTVLTGAAFLMGPRFVQWANHEIRLALECNRSPVSDPEAFGQFLAEKFIGAMLIAGPFFLALMIAGIGSSVAISGFNFSVKTLKFRADSLNPVKGFKRLFSPNSLVKLLFSVVKILFIAVIVYVYVRGRLEHIASFQWAWSMALLSGIARFVFGVLIRLCIGLAIIAVADLIYQKWNYIRKLKMTKQEVKDERRSSEGPPEIQRKIRQKQFEAAMRRMLQDVPKANVVLVNPTHVAVALRYDPEKMGAPVVVAKGADHLCEKIKEVARGYGVPIIRRPALARNLYGEVDIGKPIPESLFVAVAEVLALIHRLKQNA